MGLLLLVVGGALGTVARHYAVLGAARAWGSAFPYGTLLVNMIGSLILGLLAERFRLDASVSPHVRLALTTGFCGGFTTYSAFNMETIRHLQDGAWSKALIYVGLTLAMCLAGGAAGVAMARLV